MIETFMLRDLALVLGVAAAMMLLCRRLQQPVVIGYLAAGLIIGPHTPPFALVKDLHSIQTLAELGLVFLMFSLGLEFSLPKLRRVGPTAALAAAFEVLGMLGIGYALGRLFGWTHGQSLFLGAILSMSSTTIIVKVFMDLKLLQEGFAQVVFGILILEDIVAVLILSVLSGFGAHGQAASALLLSALLKIGFFVVLFLVFGLWLIPRFLNWVARFQVREMTGLVVLGLCLTGAWLAAAFHFSVALGAFLIGAVIAASREIEQIIDWIHPVRDMFSAIFFVSAGMLIEPATLWEYKGPILLITVATLLGKIVTDAAGAFLAGIDLKTSFKIGVSLGQIGEFSFVIASLGASLKVTSDFFFPLAVAVSSLTTLCTPYLIRNADSLVDRLLRALPVRLQQALQRYQARVTPSGSAHGLQQATSVLSKYLVRLVVYGVVQASILLLTQGVVRSVATLQSPATLFVFLIAVALGSLPLFIVIAKYSNHILLLLVTQIPGVLRTFSVRLVYNVMLVALLGVSGCIYALLAYTALGAWPLAWGIVAVVTLLGLLSRKPLGVLAERMERALDDILGLATSEPTRTAAMTAEQSAFLHGVIEPVAVPEDSPAIQQTIRALRLREQAGVTIISIYRGGQHLSNPAPETSLQPHDILVMIGNEEERQRAKALLRKNHAVTSAAQP